MPDERLSLFSLFVRHFTGPSDSGREIFPPTGSPDKPVIESVKYSDMTGTPNTHVSCAAVDPKTGFFSLTIAGGPIKDPIKLEESLTGLSRGDHMVRIGTTNRGTGDEFVVIGVRKLPVQS